MVSSTFNINPQITNPLSLVLLGSHYYGNPFHQAKEWTYENEIGILWQRFMKISKEYQFLLEKMAITPNVAYELHYEPQDYLETNKYHVFVGIPIHYSEEIPLDFQLKPLPKVRYAKLRIGVQDHFTVEVFLNKWLKSSDNPYSQAYPYLLQEYDETYKGLEDPDSEITWYVPVVKRK